MQSLSPNAAQALASVLSDDSVSDVSSSEQTESPMPASTEIADRLNADLGAARAPALPASHGKQTTDR
jgi:hypothetical protein